MRRNKATRAFWWAVTGMVVALAATGVAHATGVVDITEVASAVPEAFQGTGDAGPVAPQSRAQVQAVHPDELLLFPEVVLDFVVSEECAEWVVQGVEHEGATHEVMANVDALRSQLRLPTRYWGQPQRKIIEERFDVIQQVNVIGERCWSEAVLYDRFDDVKSHNPMWGWRNYMLRYWHEPTDAWWRSYCAPAANCSLDDDWFPSYWLAPEGGPGQ